MLKVLLYVFGLFINMVCVSISSIYDSIFWNPQNPLFRNKSQSCSTGYMTLKVRLQSKVFFICPNTATVLQKTLTAPQSATMYENLWIAYDRSVFDQCDTSLSNTSKLVFNCTDPTLLKYFPVVFAEFTADPKSLKFKDGKKYYFIGTSDGTQTHLTDPSGGHCNDTKKGIFMKIEVYVCKKSNLTYTDEECPEEDVGVLKCRDNPTPTTALPTTVLPTTTTSSSSSFISSVIPPTRITTQAPFTQVAHTSTASTVVVSVSEQNSATQSTKATSTELDSNRSGQVAGQRGDDGMETELKRWRTWGIVALVLLLTCSVVIIALLLRLYSCRKKNRPGIITHQERSEKNPASRQESVGGVSNRGFVTSLVFNDSGDNGKTVLPFNGFQTFYEQPNETSSTGSMEMDGKKPVPHGSIVIENKEGHYDNMGSLYEVREVDEKKPYQDGSVVIENKDVHFAKNGQINKGVTIDV
ncbi:Ephrin-B2a [Porites harrisoni]